MRSQRVMCAVYSHGRNPEVHHLDSGIIHSYFDYTDRLLQIIIENIFRVQRIQSIFATVLIHVEE